MNVAPLIDPATTVVVFADTSNVDSVFVAGRAVKRNGQLVDVDLDRAFGLLEQSRDHLLEKGRHAARLAGRTPAIDRGTISRLDD